jgi:hypothetical protein
MTAEAWYIGQRAESLAIMYLTRRQDLTVSHQRDDYGLDLLVAIMVREQHSGRVFGVNLKASISLPNSVKRGHTIAIPDENIQIIEFPFPVCLFYFTMEDDKGYYKWLLEPVLTEANSTKLQWNSGHEFKKLSDSEIHKIVSQVNRWYDARSSETGVAEQV